jgi:hypothetical protein
MLQSYYQDNWHHSYITSPYPRPVAIEVLEGGEGFDEAATLAALQVKRNPWEFAPERTSRDLDFLPGGILVPEGVYRFTMGNDQLLPPEFVSLEYDFPVAFIAWMYVQELRSHNYGARAHGDWVWYPFQPYNDATLGLVNRRHSVYMGQMSTLEAWEPNGLSVVVRLANVRLVGLFARIAYYFKEAHPNPVVDMARVNPTLSKYPGTTYPDTWYVAGMDFLAH